MHTATHHLTLIEEAWEVFCALFNSLEMATPAQTQTQFPQALKLSFPSVNRWEGGGIPPLPIVLPQIKVMVKKKKNPPNGRLRLHGEDLLQSNPLHF
ncbi:hypothetical protein [Microcoleus sp. FACHB-672]|uniref:hypothetical protein n=1 Tax=Microcoleus sp. FACHB-672 TaxID=2692825 RepID=UPI0016882C6F|nr:hypothetical protein [Microcoleus sp. FACHB-672]MBD2043604.1 hypothetical protein [Microcoleus sp. FACHB-672]